MDKEVKFITFVFENVEYITISIDDIIDMEVRGIIENHRIYQLDKSKTIEKTYHCSYFYILVDKDAKINGNIWNGKPSVERLTDFNDIVYIEYLNGNKSEEIMKIYLPYKDDESSDDNLNQSSKYDGGGNIEIIVDGNK